MAVDKYSVKNRNILPCVFLIFFFSFGCSPHSASQDASCTIDAITKEGTTFDMAARCCAWNKLFERVSKKGEATQKEYVIVSESFTNLPKLTECLDKKYGFRERYSDIALESSAILFKKSQSQPLALCELSLACVDPSRSTYIYLGTVHYRSGDFLEVIIEVHVDGTEPAIRSKVLTAA